MTSKYGNVQNPHLIGFCDLDCLRLFVRASAHLIIFLNIPLLLCLKCISMCVPAVEKCPDEVEYVHERAKALQAAGGLSWFVSLCDYFNPVSHTSGLHREALRDFTAVRQTTITHIRTRSHPGTLVCTHTRNV